MAKKHNLFEELKSYNEKGIYPLHMPGHKRLMSLPGVFTGFDYTEVDGTDDLHHPEGILKEAMERAAEVFGADRTWFLVNGSTCGNLAGVSAVCPLNGELIVARNCHRSVFHALELRNITPHWVYPGYNEDYDILGSIDPSDIEKLLDKYPKSRGVVITSPTYEGVVSDIASIAEVCHKHKVPLFVDEAHGTHFGLVPSAGFPDSAIHQGADLVVQSAHKTLVGLTQTAFLHMKSRYVDDGKVNRFIDMYETSSPSYPLMLSLDACTELILNHGREVMERWSQMLSQFDERIMGLRNLRVLGHGQDKMMARERLSKAFYDYDHSKILINCRNTSLTGEGLMALLRDRYHFELEMSLSDNGLAMTGPGDDHEEILRFADALLEIDRDLEAKSEEDRNISYEEVLLHKSERVLTIQEAVEAEGICIKLDAAIGHISGEYVYCYPPGIPLIVPGEKIEKDLISRIKALVQTGCQLHFTKSKEDDETIFVTV